MDETVLGRKIKGYVVCHDSDVYAEDFQIIIIPFCDEEEKEQFEGIFDDYCRLSRGEDVIFSVDLFGTERIKPLLKRAQEIKKRKESENNPVIACEEFSLPEWMSSGKIELENKRVEKAIQCDVDALEKQVSDREKKK